MATAEQTKPEVKTGEKVTFLSKRYPDLRVVIEPEQSALVDVSDRVIRPHKRALDAQFDRFRFETDDPRLIDGLINGKSFNRDYYLMGHAPDEPKPTVAEQVTAISEAAANRDLGAIAEVIKTEKETHNRESVLIAAEGAQRAIADSEEN